MTMQTLFSEYYGENEILLNRLPPKILEETAKHLSFYEKRGNFETFSITAHGVPGFNVMHSAFIHTHYTYWITFSLIQDCHVTLAQAFLFLQHVGFSPDTFLNFL